LVLGFVLQSASYEFVWSTAQLVFVYWLFGTLGNGLTLKVSLKIKSYEHNTFAQEWIGEGIVLLKETK